MKIAIVSGSQRENSRSLSVARYLESLSLEYFDTTRLLDLHHIGLPFWNEGVWQKTDEWQLWEPVSETLKSSDAVILITPEWHGMATPALKNFLLLTTDEELAHKPVLLVGVSVSVNGVYPISELRMTGSKNNHACFLPDHLIFRNVEELLSDEHQCRDQSLHQRSKYTMKLLAKYARALAPVHREMVTEGKVFRYGM